MELLDACKQRLITLQEALCTRCLRCIAVQLQKMLASVWCHKLCDQARRLARAAARNTKAPLSHVGLGRRLDVVECIAQVVRAMEEHSRHVVHRARNVGVY